MREVESVSVSLVLLILLLLEHTPAVYKGLNIQSTRS